MERLIYIAFILFLLSIVFVQSEGIRLPQLEIDHSFILGLLLALFFTFVSWLFLAGTFNWL